MHQHAINSISIGNIIVIYILDGTVYGFSQHHVAVPVCHVVVVGRSDGPSSAREAAILVHCADRDGHQQCTATAADAQRHLQVHHGQVRVVGEEERERESSVAKYV